MAIIKCPECGRDISSEATSCPHCGCPFPHEPAEANAVAVVIVAAIVIFFILWLHAPALLFLLVIPLVMVTIGLLVKNKVAKIFFIVWAIWTFLVNIGNL